MSMSKMRQAALVVTGAAAVAMASAGCGWEQSEIPHEPGIASQYRPTDAETIVVEPLHGFDVHNRNALAGWADAVFVGHVVMELGTWNAETVPETQYLVRAVSPLKGNPIEEVIVNQPAPPRGLRDQLKSVSTTTWL